MLRTTLANDIVRSSFEVLMPEDLQWPDVVRKGEEESYNGWNKWIDECVVDEATKRLTGSNRDTREKRKLRQMGMQ